MENSAIPIFCELSRTAATNTRKLLDHFKWTIDRLMREVRWTGNPSTFYKLIALGDNSSPYTKWPLGLAWRIAEVFSLTLDELSGAVKCELLAEADDPQSRWNPSKQNPKSLLDVMHEHASKSIGFVPEGIPIHFLTPVVQPRMVGIRYGTSSRSVRRNLAKYVKARDHDLEQEIVPYGQTEILVPESQLLALASSKRFTPDELEEALLRVRDKVIAEYEVTLRSVHDEALSIDRRRALVAQGGFAVMGDSVVIQRSPGSDVVSWSTSESRLESARKQLEEIRSFTDKTASRVKIVQQFDTYLRIASGTLEHP